MCIRDRVSIEDLAADDMAVDNVEIIDTMDLPQQKGKVSEDGNMDLQESLEEAAVNIGSDEESQDQDTMCGSCSEYYARKVLHALGVNGIDNKGIAKGEPLVGGAEVTCICRGTESVCRSATQCGACNCDASEADAKDHARSQQYLTKMYEEIIASAHHNGKPVDDAYKSKRKAQITKANIDKAIAALHIPA